MRQAYKDARLGARISIKIMYFRGGLVKATPNSKTMAGTRKTNMPKRSSMQGRKRRRNIHHAHHGTGILATALHRYPRWAWWVGGLCVVAFYVWIFYYIFVGPFGFRWRALYGDAKYPEGYEIHGIDISHHQGEIDWELLRNAMIEKCPIRFILIKATEGTSIVDSRFKDNFTQAREYGFIRGAYHFWSNKSSARDQAYFSLTTCC